MPRHPTRRVPSLGRGALVLGLVVAGGCAGPSPTPPPSPTPAPTELPPPTASPTEALPTDTATPEASATPEPSATLPATSAPARTAAAAPPRPTAVPPAPAVTYDVRWWADQPRLPKDLGCTTIHWEVVGAKEVYLRWPHQDENKVQASGVQEGVCIDEGERAVFTLRVVKPDGSQDVREMVLERED
jgi:hypothetical protein